MLILLTGCTEKNNEEQQRGKTNLEYEYIAESSEYVYKITPDTLEIQYKEKLSSPIVINPEINKITYAEVDAAEFDIKQKFNYPNSVFFVSELMKKVFNKELETQTEKKNNAIEITGPFGKEYKLIINQETYEPAELYWLGEIIKFKY